MVCSNSSKTTSSDPTGSLASLAAPRSQGSGTRAKRMTGTAALIRSQPTMAAAGASESLSLNHSATEMSRLQEMKVMAKVNAALPGMTGTRVQTTGNKLEVVAGTKTELTLEKPIRQTRKRCSHLGLYIIAQHSILFAASEGLQIFDS